MGRFADTFLNWEVMAQYAPKIVEGFFVTIHLAALVVVTGIAVGLTLAVVRTFRFKILNFVIVLAVDVMRALPPLVLIMILYFALPTAFSEEIFWAGILAVPRGQWEAARSTGLGFMQTMNHVVLPQALRLTIPPLTNRTIAITKGTALGATVAVGEILYQAQTGYSFSYNPSPLTLGAIAYLILFIPVVWFGRWVETRFAWKR
jgi:His/Glu/Gln/Arg/opine family amino acid ABC transporter permease subunit